MQLEILDFIESNPDWENKLMGSPYFVKTKREDGLVLTKYDQTHSDMTIPLVRECRGIILDETNGHQPVCVPLFKFGNFGESYIPDIDWTSACIQEKLDGSLIKLWYHAGEWRVSSNGEINARNAYIRPTLLNDVPETNLHALFSEA